MLVLSETDLARALPMSDAIDSVEHAYRKYSLGETQTPVRQSIETGSGVTLVMPGYISGQGTGVKVVSVYEDNPARGLPAVWGAMLLVDAEDGRPLAVMDAASLTAVRTAAAGAVAARYLARPDSKVAALFGAGVQGSAQVRALTQVLPLQQVRVYDIQPEQAEAMIARLPEKLPADIGWTIAGSPSEAVRGADVVICATTSRHPVFDGCDLDAGTHVTGVGSYAADMREIDADTFRRADLVVVDSQEACIKEAGDLIIPVNEGELSWDVVQGEIGQVIAGQLPGRESPEDVTVFKCVGLAALDVAAARAAYQRAERNSLGVRAPLEC